MAKSNKNVIVHGLSGKVGDLVVFRQRFGKTLVGKIPFNSGKRSESQQAVREKFLKAVAWAKSALADADLKVLYSLRANGGVTAFNLAIGDFFTAPEITEVITTSYTGKLGDKIEVMATDDTKIAEVNIIIEAADGTQVEQGLATQQSDTGNWLYTATQGNPSVAGTKITVIAKDLPGNLRKVEKVM
jgi:hypothetical protein